MNRQNKPSTSGNAKPAAAPKVKKPSASSKRTSTTGKADTKSTGHVPPEASTGASPSARPGSVPTTVQLHQVFAVGLVSLTDRSHTAMGTEAALRLREALDEAVLPLAVMTDTDAFEITLALMAPETVFPVMPGGRAKQREPADRAEKGERAGRGNSTDMAPKAPSKNSPLRKAT
ncbi:hypothetical protein J2W49_004868 [Hydrogenophaga palleronii]|uniref:Uncharacterized protein n=1 Tax=Hydrogenophaga palleronii TaxID=65655 RepID=A0ABU1WUA8_9BURK|nr:hypothetical protein [Hydrogenophaga palleronii]MDR7152890.1 hypothetical protein [Hydrogenophaga palleronii]